MRDELTEYEPREITLVINSEEYDVSSVSFDPDNPSGDWHGDTSGWTHIIGTDENNTTEMQMPSEDSNCDLCEQFYDEAAGKVAWAVIQRFLELNHEGTHAPFCAFYGVDEVAIISDRYTTRFVPRRDYDWNHDTPATETEGVDVADITKPPSEAIQE